MTYSRIRSAVVGLALWAMPLVAAAQSAGNNLLRPRRDIFLLQPFDGTYTINNPGTMQVLFTYFGMAWPWLFGTAAGVGVLWVMYVGIQYMWAGEDSGARDQAKNHLIAVIIGLVIIAMSGIILTILNSTFFI